MARYTALPFYNNSNNNNNNNMFQELKQCYFNSSTVGLPFINFEKSTVISENICVCMCVVACVPLTNLGSLSFLVLAIFRTGSSKGLRNEKRL
jgi:hypothetical protein